MNKLTETEIAADGKDNGKNIIGFTDKTEKNTHHTKKALPNSARPFLVKNYVNSNKNVNPVH